MGWLSWPDGPAQKCAQVAADTSFWGSFIDPTCPYIWGLEAPEAVFFYAFNSMVAAVTGLWVLWRESASSPGSRSHRLVRDEEDEPPDEATPGAAAVEDRSAAQSSDAVAEDDEGGAAATIGLADTLMVECFADSTAGQGALLLLALFYLQWIRYYALTIAGYYWECEVEGINNLCFYGSYPVFGSFNRK